jgi:hypothetical protein
MVGSLSLIVRVKTSGTPSKQFRAGEDVGAKHVPQANISQGELT